MSGNATFHSSTYFIYFNVLFSVILYMNCVIFRAGKFKPVIKKAMVELEGIFTHLFFTPQ